MSKQILIGSEACGGTLQNHEHLYEPVLHVMLHSVLLNLSLQALKKASLDGKPLLCLTIQ